MAVLSHGLRGLGLVEPECQRVEVEVDYVKRLSCAISDRPTWYSNGIAVVEVDGVNCSVVCLGWRTLICPCVRSSTANSGSDMPRESVLSLVV